MSPTTHRPAYWLNGLTWALLGLGLLLAGLRRGGYDALGTLLLTLPVAGLGSGLNLFLFLWYSLQGHGQRARPYLLGFVFLLLSVAVQVAWL